MAGISRNNSPAAGFTQVSSVYGNEEVMIDIMSRLHVKSLMRFKCLSKRCLYLIGQDKHLISLHYSRSTNSQKLLITSYRGYYSPSRFFELDLSKRSIEQIRIMEQIPNPKYVDGGSYPVLGHVNGLLCFTNKIDHSVCIHNLCTREETPWLRPITTKISDCTFGFGFGFDPVTQKHKVLFLFRKPYNRHSSDHKEINCKVLTVGENYWRTKEVVAVPKRVVLYGEPFYLNGSIYWCKKRRYSNAVTNMTKCTLVVFDVGKEMFRVIKYPDIVMDPYGFHGSCKYIDVLLEGFDGRLVLMDKWYYDDESKVTKMRIWMIDDDKENNTTNWIGEETIYLPLDANQCKDWIFASITDFLVITLEIRDYSERHERGARRNRDWHNSDDWHREIYLYDMKKKKVIEFGRLFSLSQFKEFFLCSCQPKLSVFRSSIYPVCATVPPPKTNSDN